MAYRKKVVPKKRAPARKRVSRPKPVRSIIPRNNPFPMQNVVKMRYCCVVQLNASAAGSDKWLFYANSIYDPDYTGAGHQPYGHDTWATVYNHYEVQKSRISCTFTSDNNTTTNTATQIVGIAIKDDLTVESNFDTIREAKGAHYGLMNVSSKKTITNGFNMKKMFPRTSSESSGAQFGANPTEQAIYQVFITGITGAVDPAPTNVMVTIDYTVRVWELKDLGQS